MSTALLRPLLVAALLAALLPAVGAGAAGCPTVTQEGQWTVVRTPAAEGGMVVHAAAPADPRTSYVSDGTVLHRTTDGGCTWRAVWRVPATAASPLAHTSASARIVQVAVAATRTSRVVVLVQDAAREGRLHVVRSDDAGATWEAGDEGLVAVARDVQQAKSGVPGKGRCGNARDCALRIAPSDPDVLYLFAARGLTSTFLRSSDGGRRWELRNAVGDPTGGGLLPLGLTSLEVDPVDPDVVWAALLSAVSRSQDGGETWSARYDDAFDDDWLALQGEPGRVTTLANIQTTSSGRPSGDVVPNKLVRSADGGATLTAGSLSGLGLRIESFTSGSRPDDLVALVTDGRGALQAWAPRRSRWVDVDTRDLLPRFGPTSEVQHSRAGFTVLGPKHLLTYRGPVGVDLAPVRTTAVRPR